MAGCYAAKDETALAVLALGAMTAHECNSGFGG